MNRKQFAQTVADAYVNQYCKGGSRVMNNPRIDYDPENRTFSWCSSLTPSGNDIPVMELEDGIFGQYNSNAPKDTERTLIRYLTDAGNNSSDDIWEDVKATIASNN